MLLYGTAAVYDSLFHRTDFCHPFVKREAMLIKLAGKYNNCLTSPYADFCISIAGRRSNFLAACSRYQRNDKKVQTTTYLGRHIKDDLYYCKGDGYFRFNLETYEYIDIDDFFLNRESERLLKYQNCILNLDASYLIIQFLYSTGLIDVLDFFNKEDYDTFMTLLLSRIVTSKQITELNDWYNSSFLQLMYYRADVRLENCINFFSIIENDKYRSYFYKLYLEYISKNYRLDKNIIINCTEVSNIRLLYVANKSTEIPIFYAFPSKSASDIDSLPFMVEHMQKYGLKITDCIFDSGAYTSDNLDIFYDDKICAGIEYLILLNSDDENVRIAKEEFKNTIVSDTNRVKFENKILYVTEKEVYVGKNKDKKAFMYLCYNPSEDTNGHKNSQETKTDTQKLLIRFLIQ